MSWSNSQWVFQLTESDCQSCTYRRSDLPARRLLSLSVNLLIRQSASQPVSQLVSRSVSQSVSQLVSQSVSQSVSWSVSQSVSQLVSQSARRSVNQSVSLLVRQTRLTISKLVKQWTKCGPVSQLASSTGHIDRLKVKQTGIYQWDKDSGI